jgi:dinuclear metal center YbgI/SA1388 family protein
MSLMRRELENYIGQLLSVDRFRDYSPNGLQIEGCNTIRRIVTGVTASQALIDAAIAQRADALIVHHGFFWKNENPCLTHTKKARIAKLLANDVNLLAYHLPLDAHSEFGNNAQLALRLGITPTGRHGEQDMVWLGELPQALPLAVFGAEIGKALNRTPLLLGDTQRPVRKVAWCSGGAQSYFHDVAMLDVDCFITGEASEFVTHLAQESGVAFIAAGHHATETFGVAALGQHLAAHFGLTHLHIDIENPV